MSVELEFDLDRELWHPGERVTGRIVVKEGGRSRGLDLTLGFYERTKNLLDVTLPAQTERIHEGRLETGARLPFALPLPPDAPPAFRCDYGELYWALWARSDELGRDTRAGQRIRVERA